MYSKTILLLFVLSPLWFSLFIGYPIVSQKVYVQRQNDRPGITLSKRCFAVGDFREFTNCFVGSEKIKGIDLFYEVFVKTDSVSPLFTILFIVSLIAFVVISVALVM